MSIQLRTSKTNNSWQSSNDFQVVIVCKQRLIVVICTGNTPPPLRLDNLC